MIVGGGAWEDNFSFKSRFENGKGTSPEELIAAAHAACFSMAFSHALNEAGYKPISVDTEAAESLEQVDGGFAITKIKLISKGKAVIPLRKSVSHRTCWVNKAGRKIPLIVIYCTIRPKFEYNLVINRSDALKWYQFSY